MAVGIETSTSNTFSSPSRTEIRILYATTVDDTLKALAPGQGWVLLQFPDRQTVWLPSDVRSRIAVHVTGS